MNIPSPKQKSNYLKIRSWKKCVKAGITAAIKSLCTKETCSRLFFLLIGSFFFFCRESTLCGASLNPWQLLQVMIKQYYELSDWKLTSKRLNRDFWFALRRKLRSNQDGDQLSLGSLCSRSQRSAAAALNPEEGSGFSGKPASSGTHRCRDARKAPTNPPATDSARRERKKEKERERQSA